jgi:hypothetical protein
VRGKLPVHRARITLERADDFAGDPAAIVVARLRRHLLIVHMAGIHPARLEGDVVLDRGIRRIGLRISAQAHAVVVAQQSVNPLPHLAPPLGSENSDTPSANPYSAAGAERFSNLWQDAQNWTGATIVSPGSCDLL